MPLRLVRVVLVIMVTFAPACAGADGSGAGSRATGGTDGVSQARVDEAMIALCDIAERGVTDPDEARKAFYDHAHETIHAVAAAAQGVDPTVAGTLLEAKFAVEDALESPSLADLTRGAPGKTGLARRLINALTDAVNAIGLTPTACPG